MGEYLLLRVGDEHFPKNNFGLILEPKYPIYLKLGYFWSPRRDFWHRKTPLLIMYDSKDELKSMLKWTTGPKSRSTTYRHE